VKRRAFLGAALGSLIAPTAALAQPERVRRRIGWLDSGSSGANLPAFEQAMLARGWIKGETFGIDYRGGDGSVERLAAATAELVRLPADVIVAPGSAEALAAKNATRTLPIVIAGVDDPVARGLVASLSRPGRNLTGVALARRERGNKLLSLIRELAPGPLRVAVLSDSEDADHRAILRDLRAAARTTRVTLESVAVEQYTDVEPAVAAIRRRGNRVLVVPPSRMFVPRWLADLALTNRLALASMSLGYAYEGGLLACDEDWTALFARVAGFVDRILRGARPETMPVEPATKFKVIVNARTARALKLALPPALISHADAVIE
jgi:putative ABC transport system substrate-binding protein